MKHRNSVLGFIAAVSLTLRDADAAHAQGQGIASAAIALSVPTSHDLQAELNEYPDLRGAVQSRGIDRVEGKPLVRPLWKQLD
jgi:hypothetical protein